MSRPTTMKVDGTVYWAIFTYTDAGVLVDADSTPTVAVRKNGGSTADVVTVTKRSATTGIYDCSHSPSGEVEGDCFSYEETATMSSQAYMNPWSLEVLATERGTDGANTVTPVDVSADVAAILADTNELQTNQGDWATATGFNTVAPDNASVAAILADTNELQGNQGQWLTATGFNTVAPDNASITAILADTNELQVNQGQWVTATGFNTVAPDNASIAAILVDTADLQANQGQWLTATGFNTIAPVDVSTSVAAILADTNELQSNQGDWATATGFSTFDHTLDLVTTDTDSRDASKADVSGLSTFDPSFEVVTTDGASRDASKADVSGLSTFDASLDQVVASNMRGTDGANTVTPNTIAPVDVSADVALILADTADLQANQGQWLTATGFNTVAPDNAGITANGAAISALNDLTASEVENAVWDATVSSHVVADSYGLRSIVALNSNRTMQLTGSHHAAADVHEFQADSLTSAATDASFVTEVQSGLALQATSSLILADTSDLQSNQGQWLTATGFSTFDPASDTVAHVTLVDTTTDLTNGGSGGGGDATLANQVTILANQSTILADTNELQSNQGQWLTATTTISSNMRGTDGANTVTPNTIAPDNAGILANGVAIAALNDFDPALDTVAHVTLVDTTTDLTNGGGGGGSCPTVQEIVDGWGNQPQGAYTTPDTLGFYLDAQVSTAGSGGTGLYQATVRIEDESNNSLQGARVNVDGTTLTLTTGTSGEVTFNLDSGIYLLEVSPPAGYGTPIGQVVTVSGTDPADTTFTLTDGCGTVPWIG